MKNLNKWNKKKLATQADDQEEMDDEPDKWGRDYVMFSYYIKMHEFFLEKKHIQ
jgi:hypothetical protein